MQYAPKKRLFSEEETAIYIGRSRSWLRKARMNGTLEGATPAPLFIKVGPRSIRYRLEDLEAWIAQFSPREHLAQR